MEAGRNSPCAVANVSRRTLSSVLHRVQQESWCDLREAWRVLDLPDDLLKWWSVADDVEWEVERMIAKTIGRCEGR